jgi:hypothetical protein
MIQGAAKSIKKNKALSFIKILLKAENAEGFIQEQALVVLLNNLYGKALFSRL